MTNRKPRVLATRHFPPDVETRLTASFDAVLNPEDRLYDGPALVAASASTGHSRTRRASAACASAHEMRQVATASAAVLSFLTSAEPVSAM